jgi:hypothetical protein
MKKIILPIFLFSTLNTFSQKVWIQGTAFDTTIGINWVNVTVNDTINKYLSDKIRDYKDYLKLVDDTIYVVHTDYKGHFKIKANKTDSLFFESYRHIPKSYLVADLLKMNKINIKLEPQVCETLIPCKDTMPKHFVFIG